MYSGKNITVKLNDTGIAELIFDAENSPVNIFNAQTVLELSEALSVLEDNSSIKGLLVHSTKKGFIAGADITEFASVFAQGGEKIAALLKQSNRNFNRIESLPFPVVVGINGFALGGGCEITLACDYRIASEDVRIGLPETRLGIIPGWGGCVRLPRIAGIETAVEWVTAAKDHRAKNALSVGVIDGVVAADQLYVSAMHTLQECVDGKLDYQARRAQKNSPLQHNQTELTMAFMTSKAMVGAQAGKHYPAPLAAIAVMEKSAGLQRDAALVIETEAFVSMAQTSVALSLSGIFVNDQIVTKKAKHLAKTADKTITRAAVLGAGIMGGGIAYQSALRKVPIKLKDVQQSGIDLGLLEAKKLLAKQVQRGRLSIHDMGQVLNSIEPCLSYDGFDQTDIVVEAVVENPKVKRAVLSEVENHISDDTILTSNTSTISIDHLAESLQRPENFCGMHFFNPVHAMPLVEVIRGAKTSDNTIAATVAYANTLGKKAIVVGDCPGFLVNRVLFPYFAGFLLLLRDGASFQDVDRAMESWGWPMGPAYLLDVVGIDTAVHAASVMAEGFPDRMQREFTSATDVLFEAKRLGQKNGQGFYNYELDKKGKLVKLMTEDSIELIAPHVKPAQPFSDEEIVMRMMIPMATELARCLEEGIVASPAEADMALIYGLGFPPFRGGVFRWMDSVGVNTLNESIAAYSHLGELYQATDGIKALSADGGSYYSVQVGGQ